ncbi:MAG: ACT domain-containing protein, partial [Halanaerobiales bacterium]
ALAGALESGKVAGAALDSHENEPFDPDEYALTDFADRVVMTCHLGASTSEAMDRVATNAAEQVLEVLKGNLPLSPLNIGDVDLDEASKPVLDLSERLGKFASGSLNGGRVEQIEIELGVEAMKGQEDLIAIHAVKEILGKILGGRINMVNALVVAEERGIEIKKSFVDKSDDFNNYLRVTLNTDKGEYSAAGDIEVGGPQLVEVDGYRVELSLEGKFLVLVYKDKPGVIGRIGTILGENNINIGSMHVGRDKEMEKAIMLLKADSRVGKDVREKIKTSNEVEIDEVKYIEIEE